jgi:hypothetical protein
VLSIDQVSQRHGHSRESGCSLPSRHTSRTLFARHVHRAAVWPAWPSELVASSSLGAVTYPSMIESTTMLRGALGPHPRVRYGCPLCLSTQSLTDVRRQRPLLIWKWPPRANQLIVGGSDNCQSFESAPWKGEIHYFVDPWQVTAPGRKICCEAESLPTTGIVFRI